MSPVWHIDGQLFDDSCVINQRTTDEDPHLVQRHKLQEGQARCALSGCDLKARLRLEHPSSEHSIRELSIHSPAASDCIGLKYG